jgi:hypothetical protein
LRILTIPAFSGGDSHLIPLYVLDQRYFKRIDSLDNNFLIKKQKSQQFLEKRLKIVDIDYNLERQENINYLEIRKLLIQKELEAFQRVKPSLILEDNCFSSPLIAEKMNIRRISIHRTGFFRSIDKKLRNPKHCHSSEKGEGDKRAATIMDFISPANWTKTPRCDEDYLRNYLKAKTKIVPGIRSLEVLPDELTNDESYFFSGPLLVEDNPSEVLMAELNKFFSINGQRKKAFITTGLIDRTSIVDHIEYLLKRDYAVISTLKHKVTTDQQNSFFYNPFLPLNLICAKVDIFIHQCGNGIYHYPILNEKPSITVGTQCYDREDVALRLQELGVSKHIPHPEDNKDYLSLFAEAIEEFEKGSLTDFETLKKLKDEIYETMLSFDARKLIDFTLKN